MFNILALHVQSVRSDDLEDFGISLDFRREDWEVDPWNPVIPCFGEDRVDSLFKHNS